MNGTRPEQERDTICDTPNRGGIGKSLISMEAGTGIEPVYTDLQSAA
jgi:hypothetical protein